MADQELDDDDFVWVPSPTALRKGGGGDGATDMMPLDAQGVSAQPKDYWNGGERSRDSVLLCEGYLKKRRGWGRVSSFRARWTFGCASLTELQ